jgi:hypothetical protein
MPDVHLHLTPTTAIRGTTAPAQPFQPSQPDEPAALFAGAVYDCIDLVGHPPDRDRKLKRGAFSRDFWARLIRVPSGRPKTELESLASLAPIRASVTLNRMVHVPVMTVPGLLKLIDCVMHDLHQRTTISDYHKEHVTSVRCTLARFQAGDSSMLQVLPEPVPEIDTTDVAPARARKKRKTVSAANAANADVLLRLTDENTIFGTPHPRFEHVFSVYAFFDLIGRQLSQSAHCLHFARRFWKQIKEKCPDLRQTYVMASIRCSSKFRRRINTPAMNVEGLIYLMRLVRNHDNTIGDMYRGKRQNKTYYPLSEEIVAHIGHKLDTYMTGDRSMVEEII